ncbi:MAG: bifunctional glutamate N-acetyltransferase/amino-acid acetyltransferase ArgJ [Deltaproteobacteria bacterium]|nr:bifunctional glutamate N-acetyltransferase/amino-acid acetyltransferase ArgJ [Deltaproteobacteria bacterium]
MMIHGADSYVVPGFEANGIHAGIKDKNQKDLALIFSTVPANVAGVFTKNCFKAASVVIDQERVRTGSARAILVNSGNANAATGPEGYEDAILMARLAAERLQIKEELVLVSSTGIIGHRLPMKIIESKMDNLVKGLRKEGIGDAQEAIMTTDKFPKMACRKGMIGSREITVCGIAKGAGMIEPNMATMLAYIMTDASIELAALRGVFRQAVNRSFNAITVDGCMSTNDTAIIMANGTAGNSQIKGTSKDLSCFREMLFSVTSDIAEAMVRDGEGATKVIEIIVEEAGTKGDAKKIACAIANSNLVKTAMFGSDPNWGRILSAAGAAGVSLPVDAVRLYLGDVPVFAAGQGIYGSEGELADIMAGACVRIRISLGMGNKTHRILASDLSDEYIRINAHYHT